MRFCEKSAGKHTQDVYEIVRQLRKVKQHVYHIPMKRIIDTMKRVQRKEGTVTKRFNGKKKPLRKETGLYDNIGDKKNVL